MVVVREVAAQFRVRPEEVSARKSPAGESRARHPEAHELLCYRLHVELKWTYPQIARFLGRPEHTSVMAAAKRHAKRVGVGLVG
jgi:chromosomal replication initiation ATPase DnaA